LQCNFRRLRTQVPRCSRAAAARGRWICRQTDPGAELMQLLPDMTLGQAVGPR